MIDPERIVVRFAVGDGDMRSITVAAPGENGARYVDAASEWSDR